MEYAPIALFVYNRPWHTRQTVEALIRNTFAKESALYIFSDAPANDAAMPGVNQVRDYLKTISGFKAITIIERKQNFGLAKSIISGVTEVVNKHDKIVVLEDDLVTSPYFLKFMNDGLCVYEHLDDVASIHGYVYPIDGLPETFFLRGADCWGWGTWKDRWTLFESDGTKLMAELNLRNLTRRFDFNGTYPFARMLAKQIAGKNDSWAIRWHASAFLKDKFTLYLGRSLVQNIGVDGSGTHCGGMDEFTTVMAAVPVRVEPIPVEESKEAFLAFERYFKSLRTGLVGIARRAMRDILRRI